MAILIKTDGTSQPVQPKSGERFSLEELQGFVGGLIERVPLDAPSFLERPSFEMLVNEEGLILELPDNDLATMLARQPIVGNAVVLSRAEWDALKAEDEDEA